MINNCKFINIILGVCDLGECPCPFMADPDACPDYGELEVWEKPIPPSHPDWIDHLAGIGAEGVDHLRSISSGGRGSFLDRAEAELDKRGIEHEVAGKPDRPCSICGSNTWWLRTAGGKPEWLCSRCHPKPEEEPTEVPDWF